MDYDPAGNDFRDAVDSGVEVRELVQHVVDLGADYWRARSVRRTGHNASAVVGYVDPGGGHQFGVVYAYSRYARYREEGTRDNAAEHVLSDFSHLIGGL